VDAEAFEQYKQLKAGDAFIDGALTDLIAEVERLSAIVEKHIDPSQVMLTHMNIQNGSLDIGLEGGPVRIFASSFTEFFKESQASNYIEMQISSTDPEIGELTCTLQRKHGKTPHQLRAEAERARDEAHAEVERLRQSGAAHCDALQRAGTAAGLLAGDDLHRYLVPAIERLHESLASAEEIIRKEMPPLWTCPECFTVFDPREQYKDAARDNGAPNV